MRVVYLTGLVLILLLVCSNSGYSLIQINDHLSNYETPEREYFVSQISPGETVSLNLTSQNERFYAGITIWFFNSSTADRSRVHELNRDLGDKIDIDLSGVENIKYHLSHGGTFFFLESPISLLELNFTSNSDKVENLYTSIKDEKQVLKVGGFSFGEIEDRHIISGEGYLCCGDYLQNSFFGAEAELDLYIFNYEHYRATINLTIYTRSLGQYSLDLFTLEPNGFYNKTINTPSKESYSTDKEDDWISDITVSADLQVDIGVIVIVQSKGITNPNYTPPKWGSYNIWLSLLGLFILSSIKLRKHRFLTK